MQRRSARGNIRPKISTMPRQKTEAAAFLDIYKLVVEKKRLQQELESLEQRREQIYQRLAVLESQVSGLETTVDEMRHGNPGMPQSKVVPSRTVKDGTATEGFDTLYLEY